MVSWTARPPRENPAAIESALVEAGNRDYSLEVLPKLNHMFQTSQTGSMVEWGSIEETIALSALALIGDWIESHVQRISLAPRNRQAVRRPAGSARSPRPGRPSR